jgi:5-bromo-4-chloroindolyl phosphate hydrolysis protein
MKSFFQFLFRSFVAAFTAVLVWTISYLAFDQTFIASILFGLLGGVFIFLGLKWFFSYRFLRMSGLSRKEYNYIKKNLKEAKLKINRLQKAMWRTRNLANVKQNVEVIRLVNKIYGITKREPKRFYQAEHFYYTNLDSIVELTEKYAFLNSQPSKTPELSHSLKETRLTMNQLADSLEKDLYIVLEDDIDDLQFELDVAKKSMNKRPFNR